MVLYSVFTAVTLLGTMLAETERLISINEALTYGRSYSLAMGEGQAVRITALTSTSPNKAFLQLHDINSAWFSGFRKDTDRQDSVGVGLCLGLSTISSQFLPHENPFDIAMQSYRYF